MYTPCMLCGLLIIYRAYLSKKNKKITRLDFFFNDFNSFFGSSKSYKSC